jgi:flagellin
MANIGATTAFYKVETSLTRANNEVSKSMERLATGKQNANAGDRSSYAAMADTFKLDFVGTKAGIKGASVVMGYLETGMRVLDSAAGLVGRMQELAVLGANDTNTADDSAAIDEEFVAIAKEFNRLLEGATYKGKELFNVDGAFQDRVSLGGRGAEMSFGMANVGLKSTYASLYRNETFIDHAPAATTVSPGSTVGNLRDLMDGTAGTNFTVDGTTYAHETVTTSGSETTQLTKAILKDLGIIGVQVKPSDAIAAGADIGSVTGILENLQGDLNTARVEAGSQYAAMESAVNYTTDLTAQYELGYNTVSDVNFSMETAHLAKNQILQQAATAMLSQANQGQQGLLQLLQG